MLKISPKLISVELNRIDAELLPSVKGLVKNSGIIYGGGKGLNSSYYITPERNSRFPTQLFTNIKNDRFKYVKRINI